MDPKEENSQTHPEIITPETPHPQQNKTSASKKTPSICKQCGEPGHISTSVLCKINIEKTENLTNKIKTHLLQLDWFEEDITQILEDLSVKLEITPACCKKLYATISPMELLLGRPMNLIAQIDAIQKTAVPCHECRTQIYEIQANTNRKWKGNIVCDTCWNQHYPERNDLTDKINQYKPIQCSICSLVKTNSGQRFHYDHLNMFNKECSIFTMVQEGDPVDDIYREIDKCQILCITCHHMVTEIEQKLGFTKIKQKLTRQINSEAITQEEHDASVIQCQELYETKMKGVYEELARMGRMR